MLTVSVCVAVYNEGTKAVRLLDAIVKQNLLPEEIVIVDDGSKDQTFELMQEFARKYTGPVKLRLITQTNRGPAAARNHAWRNATSQVCVFTDGDCIPHKDWLQTLIPAVESGEDVLAAGGIYSDPVTGNWLAKFIGFEIAWRYSKMPTQINCHGTYNLAIRRSVLEKLGGFNEQYPKPSGEDFDLTYRIAQLGVIRLVKESQVEHDHPEELWWYLKNQYRRGYDRVQLYLDHPGKAGQDSYTDPWVKFEVMTAALLPILAMMTIFLSTQFLLPLEAAIAFLLMSSIRPMQFLARHSSITLAIQGASVRFLRTFAWAYGLQAGILSRVQRVKFLRSES